MANEKLISLANLQRFLQNIENVYAKKNGNYQSLTSGLANNLDSKLVENDKSAYIFRPTATIGSWEGEVGSPCKVKSIIGGSLGFNQLALFTSNQIPSNSNGITYASALDNTAVKFDGTATAQESRNGWFGLSEASGRAFESNVGHKCLFIANVLSGSYSNGRITVDSFSGGVHDLNTNPSWVIPVTRNSINYSRFSYTIASGVVCDNLVWRVQCFDLTAMFGSTIADYIYSLEQATAGAGVAWFRRYFNKPYYPYTAIGGFIHVKTNGKKITHFNQWDEQWEVGDYSTETGAKTYTIYRIRSKNKIEALPQTTYFAQSGVNWVLCYDASENYLGTASYQATTGGYLWTTLPNTAFITFYCNNAYGTTYNNDICINFHYDGERDGEYEPYDSETYPVDQIDLIGIPKLDSNNNLTFDGNVYNSDGTINEKYGIYTFTGEETIGNFVDNTSPTYNYHYGMSLTLPDEVKNSILWNSTQNGLILFSKLFKYKYANENLCAYLGNVSYGRINLINDSATTEEQALTAIVGMTIIYPKATPTQSSATPFEEQQECDNWGTEEWLPPENDTRPCEIPVGHDTDYLPDLKAKLESAPTTPSEDGYYVLNHDESADGNPNSYADLSSVLATLGYVKLTDITGYDSSKTQTLKNVSGTLTWVDD